MEHLLGHRSGFGDHLDEAELDDMNNHKPRLWESVLGTWIMSDAVLDDPGFVDGRERFWTAAMTDERYRENRVAVERDGELIGVANVRPPVGRLNTNGRTLTETFVERNGTALAIISGRCRLLQSG